MAGVGLEVAAEVGGDEDVDDGHGGRRDGLAGGWAGSTAAGFTGGASDHGGALVCREAAGDEGLKIFE